MNSSDVYDEDYFERGVETGKSLYQNFRWLPQVSLPIANTIKDTFGGVSVLDYGCAKGFTVYALRMLGVEAWGYDVSRYAIEHCKTEAAVCLFHDKAIVPDVNTVFAKDTLEHLQYNEIDREIKWLRSKCINAMIIVPLASNRYYRITDYERDPFHHIREDEAWWAELFITHGFEVDEFHHSYMGLKQHWVNVCPTGNGIYILRGKR